MNQFPCESRPKQKSDMKQETLQKAKKFEQDFSEYTNLLQSRSANYQTMLIKISCAYANDRNEYYGRVSKDVWNKMLDVVAEERQKTTQELEALTDDSADGTTADAAPKNGTDAVDPSVAALAASLELDKPHKESWTDKFIRSLDRLTSWMLYSITFCFLLGVAGLQLSTRETVAYSLMLGLITGSINNLERVIRELFGKKEG